MSFWQRLFGLQESTHNEPAAASEVDEGDGRPYGIDSRPSPDGNDLEMLLPQMAGRYMRRQSECDEQPTDSSSIYVDYDSSGSSVFVEFGICKSADDALAALERAKAETQGTSDAPITIRTGSDGKSLHVITHLGAFFAWTRGRYYYSAHARSGASDLDEFIRCFPY
jgi:hypothetical protein